MRFLPYLLLLIPCMLNAAENAVVPPPHTMIFDAKNPKAAPRLKVNIPPDKQLPVATKDTQTPQPAAEPSKEPSSAKPSPPKADEKSPETDKGQPVEPAPEK
jgi:hypothetical protein